MPVGWSPPVPSGRCGPSREASREAVSAGRQLAAADIEVVLPQTATSGPSMDDTQRPWLAAGSSFWSHSRVAGARVSAGLSIATPPSTKTSSPAAAEVLQVATTDPFIS